MADRSTAHDIDAVPEADYVEQNIPAYPDDGVDTDATGGAAADDTELSDAVERDAFSADPADIVEQSIPVPMDDDRDPEPGY